MRNDDDLPLSTYIAISIALHIIVYFLFYFGLPHFKKDLKEEVMTFEIVPITQESNIKTQKHQDQEEQKEEDAKKQAKSKKSEPKPVEKPTPKKDVEKPKEEKKPAKKPEPKKAEAVKKAPTPPKPKPKPKPKVNEMEQLLKNLEKESQGKEEKSKKKATAEKNTAIDDAIGKYKESSPMSIGEQDYIRQKVVQNWNVPIGVQNAGAITVNLHINLNTDGTLQDVTLGGVNCPAGSEMACRAAIDSAIRAVKQASPFDQLKPDRYKTWAEFKFNFDPKDALQ